MNIDKDRLKNYAYGIGGLGLLGMVLYAMYRAVRTDKYSAMSRVRRMSNIRVDWNELAVLDKEDILDEAGIKDKSRQKRLARMKWHNLINRELKNSEHDRVIESMADFWAWKFESPSEEMFEPMYIPFKDS